MEDLTFFGAASREECSEPFLWDTNPIPSEPLTCTDNSSSNTSNDFALPFTPLSLSRSNSRSWNDCTEDIDDEMSFFGLNSLSLPTVDTFPPVSADSFETEPENCGSKRKRSAEEESSTNGASDTWDVLGILGDWDGCVEETGTVVESDDTDAEEPPKRLKRGEHVRGRTEMQATARSGQKHWASKVVELRREWAEKNIGDAHPQFVSQRRECERRHLKAQRECILLLLQILTADAVISPFPFERAQTPSLGWTGFVVAREESERFRTRIEGIFQTGAKPSTVHNSFRRAGLVASGQWERAMGGYASFVPAPPC